jgi:spore coat protein U-like protein
VKNFRKILVPTAIATALLVGAAPPVAAATASTTFLVSATVLSFCAVVATPLVFGNYSGAQLDATNTISVTCTAGTSYTVGMNGGTGTGNSITARKMTKTAGTDLLNYSLFTDSSHSVNWGDLVGTNAPTGSGTGLSQPFTVYGRIPANQLTATAGAYTDLITVTVTY